MPAEQPNDFLHLLEALSIAHVEFIIVGGTAAVLHGASTATYDLDVLMPFTLQNCQRLLNAVEQLHPRLSHTPDKRPLSLSAEELASFKNLYLLTDFGRLDLLGSLPPITNIEQIERQAVRMDVGGIEVNVISLQTLIEVKAAMGRPKDKLVETELRALLAARQGPS